MKKKKIFILSIKVLFYSTLIFFIACEKDKDNENNTNNSNPLNLELSDIPSGTFIMGSPEDEPERDSDELQHEVTISAFKMSKFEITNSQFAAFLNNKNVGSDGIYDEGSYPSKPLINPSGNSLWGIDYMINTQGEGKWIPFTGFENHPVIYVTWYGAAEFAKYAGGRLPTEAEWEYACRAGSNSPFNTGDCLGNNQANYKWSQPYNTCSNTNNDYPDSTQVVGNYPSNAFGLCDMHGNVWEWCNDWSGDYPNDAQINPTGPADGEFKIIRGGSWAYGAEKSRSAYRGINSPGGANNVFGFRIVLIP